MQVDLELSSYGTPKKGTGRPATGIDLGIPKEKIAKFINGIKSHLMGGPPHAFFAKFDGKNDGSISAASFMKVPDNLNQHIREFMSLPYVRWCGSL